MAWVIKDEHNKDTTVKNLVKRYPNLVAFDDSGFELLLDELDEIEWLNGDYTARIWFWENEEASIEDDGANSIAIGTWDSREDGYHYARNDDIEVRVDWTSRESNVQYRLLTDPEVEWKGTAFQAAYFGTPDMDRVLNTVDEWLGE